MPSGGLVPYIKPGVGAIASQSFVNPYLGIDGLRLLEDGLPAERALERVIESDPGRDLRQIGIVDKDGRTAAYTGERCIPWAGHVHGGGYVCLGNILEGEEVVNAMATRLRGERRPKTSPERLMQALEAGQDAGGDRRGRQSAGISVYAEEEYPWCDLRVDDHHDPIPELRRVFGVYLAEEIPFLAHDAPPRRLHPQLADRPCKQREAIARELDEQVPVTKES